jgi:ankyrin repeat protein
MRRNRLFVNGDQLIESALVGAGQIGNIWRFVGHKVILPARLPKAPGPREGLSPSNRWNDRKPSSCPILRTPGAIGKKAHMPQPFSSLPHRPSLENLKNQAKSLLRNAQRGDPDALERIQGVGPSKNPALHDAQLAIAREYGFPSWAKLKGKVEELARQVNAPTDPFHPLPKAANDGHLNEVKAILKVGAATQHDLDLALIRALIRDQFEMAQLLFDEGADPNGEYGESYGPILIAAAEAHSAAAVRFLCSRGAKVNIEPRPTKYPNLNTPLKMAIGSYLRNPNRRHETIEALIEAGAEFVDDALMDVLRGRIVSLSMRLNEDPALVHRHFDAAFGTNLTLRGATPLHIAADFNEREIVDILLTRGADLNARCEMNSHGTGGQTPIYHVIGSNQGSCYPLFVHLLKRTPDLNVIARIQTEPTVSYDPEKPYTEILDLTPLQYAQKFSAGPPWRESSRELAALQALAV